VPWRFFSRSDKQTAGSTRKRVTGISRDVVRLMCEMGRENHPREYGCALRAEDGVIRELVLVPGMIGGDRHTFMNTWHLPVDPSIVGTVHSHPSPFPIPSDADKQFFSAYGRVHLIIASPYTPTSWRAYDLTAAPVSLQTVE
jgi:proteasome lid subunit RPN8/RPN11